MHSRRMGRGAAPSEVQREKEQVRQNVAENWDVTGGVRGGARSPRMVSGDLEFQLYFMSTWAVLKHVEDVQFGMIILAAACRRDWLGIKSARTWLQ